MNSKYTKAKRNFKKITKAMIAVADANHQFENLVTDDILIRMIHEQLMLSFSHISHAYGLTRKMIEQEGIKNNAEKNLANHKEPLLDYTR